jgi:hypothetical protein
LQRQRPDFVVGKMVKKKKIIEQKTRPKRKELHSERELKR